MRQISRIILISFLFLVNKLNNVSFKGILKVSKKNF